jgi:hypothetical protein
MDSNHMTAPVNFPQLAVVIPALNEKENLDLLLPALKEVVVGRESRRKSLWSMVGLETELVKPP